MFHVDLSPFGVDVERLKSDRLSRLQGIMRARDLSALLLTDPLNIRYATNTVLWLNLRATGVQRFALVPADGEPVVYERLMGSERAAGLKKAGPVRGFGAYMFGMRPPVATEHFVDLVAEGLADMGLNGERVGIDALCLTAVDLLRNKGFAVVDGLPALGESRVVKTQDEVELIRWTSRAKEGGYDLVREFISPSASRRCWNDRAPQPHDARIPAGAGLRGRQRVHLDLRFLTDGDTVRIARPMGMDLVMTEGDLLICDATVISSCILPPPLLSSLYASGPGGAEGGKVLQRLCPHVLPRHPLPSRTRTVTPRPTPRCRRPSAISSAGPCTALFERFGQSFDLGRLPGLDGFHGVGMCIYEAPWLRGYDPPLRSTSFPWKRT